MFGVFLRLILSEDYGIHIFGPIIVHGIPWIEFGSGILKIISGPQEI